MRHTQQWHARWPQGTIGSVRARGSCCHRRRRQRGGGRDGAACRAPRSPLGALDGLPGAAGRCKPPRGAVSHAPAAAAGRAAPGTLLVAARAVRTRSRWPPAPAAARVIELVPSWGQLRGPSLSQAHLQANRSLLAATEPARGAPTSRPTAERQQQPRCCSRCSPHAAAISRRLAESEGATAARGAARGKARRCVRCRLSMAQDPRAQGALPRLPPAMRASVRIRLRVPGLCGVRDGSCQLQTFGAPSTLACTARARIHPAPNNADTVRQQRAGHAVAQTRPVLLASVPAGGAGRRSSVVQLSHTCCSRMPHLTGPLDRARAVCWVSTGCTAAGRFAPTHQHRGAGSRC